MQQQRGFAGAVWSKHAEALAWSDLKGEVLQGRASLRVTVGKAANFQSRGLLARALGDDWLRRLDRPAHFQPRAHMAR